MESSVDNVGVERDFYGTESESDLDARITSLENNYSRLLTDLRSGALGEGPINDERVAELVTHLTLRTRSFRDSAIGTTVALADAMRGYVLRPDYLRGELRRTFGKTEVSRMVRTGLSKQGLRSLEIERRLPQLVSRMMPLVESIVERFVTENALHFGGVIEEAITEMPTSMRTAFRETLYANLESSERSAKYGRYRWFVRTTSMPLILGDTVCVFRTTGLRTFKPLDDQTDDTLQILLPLAQNRLLIGSLTEDPPSFDVAELNSAFAGCSFEFFVSSRQLTNSEESLVQELGTRSGIITDEERLKLISDLTNP